MNIRLSDHFTYKKLLRVTLPSIVMMIFTSIYGVVDGFFVSNFVGKTPFAAVNFIMPFIMMLGAVGFMFGTGGSALISKTMGEGDCDKANRLFSLFVYVSFFCGIVIAVLGIAFLRPNGSLLRLTRTSFDGASLLKACGNGSSELMSNISMSLVSMLYNIQLIRYAGEDGVAAYGVLMYVNLVFLAAFIGYSIGTAPVVGYHFGAGNLPDLNSLLKKSLILICVFSVSMFILAEGLAVPLSGIFVGYDPALLALTVKGFALYSFSFLFAGIAIYGSGFFTALNNGLISAVISFLRTLVFQTAAVLILPAIWGIDGIWISIVAAELAAAGVTMFFIKNNFVRQAPVTATEH